MRGRKMGNIECGEPVASACSLSLVGGSTFLLSHKDMFILLRERYELNELNSLDPESMRLLRESIDAVNRRYGFIPQLRAPQQQPLQQPLQRSGTGLPSSQRQARSPIASDVEWMAGRGWRNELGDRLKCYTAHEARQHGRECALIGPNDVSMQSMTRVQAYEEIKGGAYQGQFNASDEETRIWLRDTQRLIDSRQPR